MRARPHVVRVRVLRLPTSFNTVSQEVSGARNESCAVGRTDAVDSFVRGAISPHHGGVVPFSFLPHIGSAPCRLTIHRPVARRLPRHAGRTMTGHDALQCVAVLAAHQHFARTAEHAASMVALLWRSIEPSAPQMWERGMWLARPGASSEVHRSDDVHGCNGDARTRHR